ncbi:hypothetical protein ACP4OV_011323 [Aristida adscensionis]
MAATDADAAALAEARSILERAAASSFPPLHAVHHLLSVGVCVRCILRLCGAYSSACSCPSLTASVLHSFLEERDDSVKGGSCPCLSTDDAYCSICLGVLLPVCHQVRAVRLYMQRKYGNESWFKDKTFSQQTMSVKEALRLLIVPSLEKETNAKYGNNSFRIRLTYTHNDASQKLQCLLPNDHSHRRKTESRNGRASYSEAHKGNSTNDNDKHIISESDSFVYKTLLLLEATKDQEFCNLFQLPPEKVSTPCHLVISCLRSPVYIGGRYLKSIEGEWRGFQSPREGDNRTSPEEELEYFLWTSAFWIENHSCKVLSAKHSLVILIAVVINNTITGALSPHSNSCASAYAAQQRQLEAAVSSNLAGGSSSARLRFNSCSCSVGCTAAAAVGI